MRPHYHDSTISRPICEVKHGQVWLVLAVGDQLGSPDAAYFFRVFSTAGSNPTVLIAVKKFQQIKYMILLCTTASSSWFGVQFCLLGQISLLAHCDAAPSSTYPPTATCLLSGLIPIWRAYGDTAPSTCPLRRCAGFDYRVRP